LLIVLGNLGNGYLHKFMDRLAAYLELAIRKSIPFSSFDNTLCAAAEKAGIDLL